MSLTMTSSSPPQPGFEPPGLQNHQQIQHFKTFKPIIDGIQHLQHCETAWILTLWQCHWLTFHLSVVLILELRIYIKRFHFTCVKRRLLFKGTVIVGKQMEFFFYLSSSICETKLHKEYIILYNPFHKSAFQFEGTLRKEVKNPQVQ